MKVSVITVSYNAGDTIERTIQSVISQTHPDIEYIVIDGGSNDSTLQIINRFKNSIHTLISEPDDGIYNAMNKGLSIASGSIVCFLNADDYYVRDNILSEVVELFTCNPIDAVFGGVNFINKHGKVARTFILCKYSTSLLRFGIFPPHPASFIRTPFLKRIGGFNESFRLAADFDIFVRITKEYKLRARIIPCIYVNMLLGGASTSGFSSALLINKEILRSLNINQINSNLFFILLRYFIKIFQIFPKQIQKRDASEFRNS
jgi:glycosyltransferase involved in cell wall biosynthesis